MALGHSTGFACKYNNDFFASKKEAFEKICEGVHFQYFTWEKQYL